MNRPLPVSLKPGSARTGLLVAAEGKRAVKMYILIKESVPLGFALVAAAHASLANQRRVAAAGRSGVAGQR
jgi:hypothetical protein